MDHSMSSALVNALRNSTSGGNLFECAIGLVVAVVVLRMESTRRMPNAPQQHADSEGGGTTTTYKKFFQQYAPEVTGLVATLCLAVALRVHGACTHVSSEETAALESIMREWPILLTADTLLSMQAMLRLLVFISCVLRAGGGPTMISQEAAAISLGAALGRAALIARSPHYMLDGPVGGYLPVACELLSVPFLALLCRGIQQRALMASALTLASAAWIGSRNRLSLADDAVADGLFLFAHTAEMLAAFAYVSRALLSDDVGLGAGGERSMSLRFAHVVMPLQQCMAAYYFLVAFEYAPGLIAAGHPFAILQIGGAAQLGAYVAAAVLHLAEHLESVPSQEEQSAAAVPQHAAAAVAMPRHVF